MTTPDADQSTKGRIARILTSTMLHNMSAFTAGDVAHFLTSRTVKVEYHTACVILLKMEQDGMVVSARTARKTQNGHQNGNNLLYTFVKKTYLKEPWRTVSNEELGIQIKPGPMEWDLDRVPVVIEFSPPKAQFLRRGNNSSKVLT